MPGKQSICFWVMFLLTMYYPLITQAQLPFEIAVRNHILLATDSVQPFWITANQHGKYKYAGSFTNLTDLYLGRKYSTKTEKTFAFTWGINGIALTGSNNHFSINSLYAGIVHKGWELKAGTFYDRVLYAGLSTSNGNLARSGNARPVPTIRFSTPGYKKLPFWKDWFLFKAEYDEGFLGNDRYVESVHLHHKSLYGKSRISQSSWLTIGFEHFVMWGGNSPVYGELPHSPHDYLIYIFALPGNDDFPVVEQNNISGNQLGTFQFEFEKQFTKFNSVFYVSHPFEDNSGLNWHNWQDNLIGIYIDLKEKKSLITDVVIEFTNTRQQSIRDSLYLFDSESGKWKMKEFDNYYNHGIYKSGFTYQGLAMSSPLFFPVNMNNGVAMGFQSNRFYAFHTGVSGYLSEFLKWKGFLTLTQHLGTYSVQYSEPRNNLSGLIELNYINPGFPVELGVSMAFDVTDYNGKNAGIQLTVAKSW